MLNMHIGGYIMVFHENVDGRNIKKNTDKVSTTSNLIHYKERHLKFSLYFYAALVLFHPATIM